MRHLRGLRFESARAYHFIAMDLTTFSPHCFWQFRTALRTAETFDLVFGPLAESAPAGWKRISVALRFFGFPKAYAITAVG